MLLTQEQVFEQIVKRGYGRPAMVIITFQIPRVGLVLDNQCWAVWMEDNTMRVFSTSHGDLREMIRDELNTLYEAMLKVAVDAKSVHDLIERVGHQYAYGLPQDPSIKNNPSPTESTSCK
jgi:hypothetical protein